MLQDFPRSYFFEYYNYNYMEKEFIPNYLAKKKKSRKVRCDIYSKEVQLKYSGYELGSNIMLGKSICNHLLEVDEEEGYYYCVICYDIVDQVFITDEKDDKIKQQHQVIWSRDYDRNRWKNYGIEYLTGVNNEKLTDQIWLDVIREVPKTFTWYEVYKIFQRNNLLEYWTAFGSYVGLPVPLSMDVMKKVDQYLNYCNTKYRITYLYLMYKFVQLEQGEEMAKYIPLGRSKAWCKKTDGWWKEVCMEEKMEYRDTKLHELSWDKDNVCSKIYQHLKQTGQLKSTKEYSKEEWELKFSQLSLKDHIGHFKGQLKNWRS